VEYYNYNIELPFSKKVVAFREINTNEQMALAKANLSFNNSKENYFPFNNFVLTTVKNILENKNDFDKINIVDYMLFLTKLRIVSIGNIITLTTESKNKEFKSTKTTIDLNVFLKNLYSCATEALVDSILLENNIEVKLGWPTVRSIKLFQDLLTLEKNQYQIFNETYHEFIEYIKINDKKISFNDFSLKQKIDLMDELSISMIKKIKDKVLDCIKYVLTYDLFGISTFKDYTFNFFNLNFIDYIRLFYSNDVRAIYQEISYLAKSGITPEYVLGISPSERKIYSTLVQEAKKMENKQDNYDFNKINSNSSRAVQDLALEFGDSPPK
jgi:hypothetical protein